MALDRTFRELSEGLQVLHDHLQALQLTIREDVPSHGAVILVDRLGDAVDDCIGWVKEAVQAGREAERLTGTPVHLDLARKALFQSQQLFSCMQQRFQSELVSYERLKDLIAFGRSRRGEWLPWVRTVKDGLDQCQRPMEEAGKYLLGCWQELADRASTGSVYVHSTNIGQQIAGAIKEEGTAERIT